MIKLPSGIDINNLIDDLRIFSWEASDILIYYSKILKEFNNDKDIIKNKNYNDPVTLADLEVNDIVIKRIKEKYKNVKWEILSEENVKDNSNKIDSNNDWLWILDPLDGTKDFIQGTGNYAMHLALNFKQNPYLGIVLIPERDELWISNGNSFWCERKNGSKPIFKMSKNYKLTEMNLVMSKNHRNKTLQKLVEKLNFNNINVMGSIGCKLASIVRGESDIYISLSLPNQSAPKDWDFAAPAAILKNAGGAITNLDNEELIYNRLNFEQPGIIIASNNKINHQNICMQIKKIIASSNF